NFLFFFSSRRRHTRSKRDWSSDVCSSDLSTSEIISYFLTFKSLITDSPISSKFSILVFKLIDDAWLNVSALIGNRTFVLPVCMRSEERRVGRECRACEWSEI